MKVKKPIFVIGAGRSGSSIFHELLCDHPHVAWLSDILERFPAHPGYNRIVMHGIDFPLLNVLFKKMYPPSECYTFWEHYCKGFSRPCRDLLKEDVTLKVKSRIRNVMCKTLTSKRSTLLVKITSWPRIGFLKEIFPDAKFIHIIRDSRAFVNSIINVDFWEGWGGPQNWRWGELEPLRQKEWEKHNKSFIALAGIQWKILMEGIQKAKNHCDETNFMEIKYESFAHNPIGVLKNTIKFCELDWVPEFERKIGMYKISNRNYKWQEELTEHQKKILENVTSEFLKYYGYI